MIDEHVPNKPSGIEILQAMGPPRMMKSHLSLRFFSKQLAAEKGKFIVVMRNIKDTLVSFFSFYRGVHRFTGFRDNTWADFFELFKAKKLHFGDWLDFNLAWWQQRDNTNVLIVKHEDMKKAPRAAILKIAEFVGRELSMKEVDRIVEHTSFEKMKDNDAVNLSNRPEVYDSQVAPFMRKGIVGDWLTVFTPEQNEYVDKNYVQKAAAHGLVFEYE